VVLGEYKTKEKALEELSAIQEAIEKGKTSVYSIK
jgi:hypothetical protein